MERRRGDRWRWRWELDDDPLDELASWDGDETLFAQIRAGVGRGAPVLASSADDSIDFTGTDLVAGTPVLQWTVPAATTDGIVPGVYRLEVQVDVDGEPVTVFSEELHVVDDSAVSS
jgi:hypothetical protein